jgi:hypothetical protein
MGLTGDSSEEMRSMKLVMFTSQLDVSAQLILNVMDLPYAKTRAVEGRLA